MRSSKSKGEARRKASDATASKGRSDRQREDGQLSHLNDKKLSKLSRVELLELLVEQGEQLERTQEELAVMTNRAACQEKIARLAEQTVSRLTGVLEASQLVQTQYEQSLKDLKAQMGVTNEAVSPEEAANNAQAVDDALAASQAAPANNYDPQHAYYGSAYDSGYAQNAAYGQYAQSQYSPAASAYQDWNMAYQAMYATDQLSSQADAKQDPYYQGSADPNAGSYYQSVQYGQLSPYVQQSGYDSSSNKDGSGK